MFLFLQNSFENQKLKVIYINAYNPGDFYYDFIYTVIIYSCYI